MLTLKRVMQLIVVSLLVTTTLNGCSTAEVAPDKSVMPEVPDYVKVPHPQGYEIAEIRALFENPLAPKDGLNGFADTCDDQYRMLARATQQKNERRQGANELVSSDAEKMHWCFYGKVERMQNQLKAETSWTIRQKIVLDSYDFLTPIANAFLNVYHDSRYMRWATQYYSNISEWIFFRKVVPGPENTLALTTSASTDLETWTTEHKNPDKKLSVFTRYGIDLKHVGDSSVTTPVEAEAAPERIPASKEDGSVSIDSPASIAPEFPVEVTTVKEPDSLPVMDTMETRPGFSAQIPDQLPKPIGESKYVAPGTIQPAKVAPVVKTAPIVKAAPAAAVANTAPVAPATPAAKPKKVPAKRRPAAAQQETETPFGI